MNFAIRVEFALLYHMITEFSLINNYVVSEWGPGVLTLKHRETHGCVVSTVATDALVLKHQAISILSTD